MKTVNALLFLIAIFLASSTLCYGDDVIKGHYCYTYGDNESLKEARELTRSLAIRDAIESYIVFVESSTNVTDFKLTSDIIQIISSGYLNDIKTISHTEENRKICETIQAKVNGKALENIVKREYSKRKSKLEETGLDANKHLKILSIKEKRTTEGTEIIVIVKALHELPERYFDSGVCIDYYDKDGDPMGGASTMASKYIHLFGGQITTVVFYKLPDAASYRVWLPYR